MNTASMKTGECGSRHKETEHMKTTSSESLIDSTSSLDLGSNADIGDGVRAEHSKASRAKYERGRKHADAYEADKGKQKLRGHPRDTHDTRVSKTLAWVLRHGAKREGLYTRTDGYVRVQDLLAWPTFHDLDFLTLERIVQTDLKERYHLLFEPGTSSSEGLWWIRANQGHTLKEVDLQFSEITDAGQVPMAVHGTNLIAWSQIQTQGLSPMKRAYIHLAQHILHFKGLDANPALRKRSEVLIYVDLNRALHDGIKFYLSANGVVLTKGDESGYLPPKYFMRVTDAHGVPLEGWSGERTMLDKPSAKTSQQQSRSKRHANQPVRNTRREERTRGPVVTEAAIRERRNETHRGSELEKQNVLNTGEDHVERGTENKSQAADTEQFTGCP